MDLQPESTSLLYTQLLSQCLQGAAPSGRGFSFVAKTIKGAKYWYLQVTVGSGKTQHFVGPDTDAIRKLIAREKSLWKSAAPDNAIRQQLVSMLVAGGAQSPGNAEARVFEILERAGLFAANGVVVGSHAFAMYGNMLGVRWRSETTRTQDIDVATAAHILVGVNNRNLNLRQVIIESKLGFIEVPVLSRKAPSTLFRIRGQQLCVDILTPLLGRTSAKPIYISSLDIYAEPVRFLDYLLVDSQPAVLVAKSGILLNVPAPARFALHKLVVSERRVAAFQTKKQKDISQAEQLLTVLARDRPGDLRIAWQAAAKQPDKFMTKLRSGLARLPRELREALASIAPER